MPIYIEDVAIPSVVYSWYLLPSEIKQITNPVRKPLLVLTPSENLIYGEGGWGGGGSGYKMEWP